MRCVLSHSGCGTTYLLIALKKKKKRGHRSLEGIERNIGKSLSKKRRGF